MEQPNITQITASTSSNARGSNVSQVFGLGDNNKIYYWDSTQHKWVLFAS